MRTRSHKRLNIRIDGPYGSSHARHLLEDSDFSLLVAGGSGIAVIWPLIHHLLALSRSSDTEIASPPTSRLQRRIVVIWVIHKGEHIDWIGRSALADAENRGVEIIIPRATEEIGRPNLGALVEEVTVGMGIGERLGVVTSGPDGMGREVRNICSGMRRDGVDVGVTVEKFGW